MGDSRRSKRGADLDIPDAIADVDISSPSKVSETSADIIKMGGHSLDEHETAGAAINDELQVEDGNINETGGLQHCEKVGGDLIISQEINRLLAGGGLDDPVRGVSAPSDGPGQTNVSGPVLVFRSAGPIDDRIPLCPLDAWSALSSGPFTKSMRGLGVQRNTTWRRVPHLGISGSQEDQCCGKRKATTVVGEGLEECKRARKEGDCSQIEQDTDGFSAKDEDPLAWMPSTFVAERMK
ncbi:hypothetical protein LWI29_005504 [Acer saccharum]|uniref:Uncharacterized protein n=1 Tax=Acer saccharum TaxID=4024 RepID=A0AA39RL58_ACESA|nr:hypothetical protein LWI29_005504 [Acer saccharum]